MTVEEQNALIVEMYSDGNSALRIGRALNIGKTTVLQRLKRMGIERRPKAMTREAKGEGVFASPDVITANYGADPNEAGVVEGDLRPINIIDINSRTTGILCDVHAPFHALYRDSNGELYGPYMTALRYLKDRECGTILLNGDFLDCYQLSRHEKIEAKRNFAWELDVARGLLSHLRKYFGPDVRIIYREGNHEERLPKILANKLPELQGLITIPELLHLSEFGIEWLGDRDRIRIGSLWVDHGHEWFGSGGVNPARAYRMKAGDNVMIGHVHRTTYDNFKRPLDGTLYAGWTVGCLCDLNPHYAPRNAWNHGVAVVELFDNGEFMVDNRIILNNHIR